VPTSTVVSSTSSPESAPIARWRTVTFSTAEPRCRRSTPSRSSAVSPRTSPGETTVSTMRTSPGARRPRAGQRSRPVRRRRRPRPRAGARRRPPGGQFACPYPTRLNDNISALSGIARRFTPWIDPLRVPDSVHPTRRVRRGARVASGSLGPSRRGHRGRSRAPRRSPRSARRRSPPRRGRSHSDSASPTRPLGAGARLVDGVGVYPRRFEVLAVVDSRLVDGALELRDVVEFGERRALVTLLREQRPRPRGPPRGPPTRRTA